MTDVRHLRFANRDFFVGKLYNKDVVLVFSKCGKVSSALTTTILAQEFKIKKLIFTGVAAGINSELKIGDIVIANKLYQYDMDARPLFPEHEIPLTNKIYYETDKTLQEQARKASETAIRQVNQTLTQEDRKSLNIKSPQVYLGNIASGDLFVSHLNYKKLSLREETFALEMEGASVAQVAHDYNLPFIIIRTVSDLANKKSLHNFSLFIEKAAMNYSRAIIENLFNLDQGSQLKFAEGS